MTGKRMTAARFVSAQIVAGRRGLGGLRLQWDRDALVVTFQTRHSDGEMAVSFRYELIDAGRRLRAVEQLRGTDHDQDNIWIFDRR